MKYFGSNTCILGMGHGDEGKGKIVQYLSDHYEWVVRFNGGGNAGHTLYHGDKKIVHHFIPCIDFGTSKAKAFIASTCVLNIEKFEKELKALEEIFPDIRSRIFVDRTTTIITDSEIEQDSGYISKFVGTTKQGVGPAYANRCLRTAKLAFEYEEKFNQMGIQLLSYGEWYGMAYYKPNYANNKKSSILFEGAQAVMLDLYKGEYPFVTSSYCGLENIYGLGFKKFDTTGIIKPYLTKVGNGTMYTECEEYSKYREVLGEYGATTGRPRRIGYLNLPELRYSIRRTNITSLGITKIDLLSTFGNTIKVCYAYEKDKELYHVAPDPYFTPDKIHLAELPTNKVEFIIQLRQLIDSVPDEDFYIPINMISNGPNKNNIIIGPENIVS